MGAPKIGYENFFETGTVTASTEATGFAKENAYDWNTYDGWKPTGTADQYLSVDMTTVQSADYFALAAHNLSDYSGTVKAQYSANGSTWSDASALVTPTTNSPILQAFTSVSARYWRLLFNTVTTPPTIGVASIGAALALDRAVGSGFAIPYDARQDTITNLQSEGGAFLGRSVIRQGVRSQMRFTLQALSFVRGDWRTFLDHAQTKPWFFTWNPTYGDAIFCWLEGDPDPPAYSSHTLLDIGLTIRGLR